LQFKEIFQRRYVTAANAVLAAGGRALLIGVDPSFVNHHFRDTRAVAAVPFAPFSEVFPMCSALICHAGIGTVGQALRAGVPVLALPFGFDQPFNARLVTRVGAGRCILPPLHTKRRIARELKTILNDDSYKQRAASLAKAIATENGVANLCDSIEQVLDSASRDKSKQKSPRGEAGFR
jgi:UDP:flavonoid glycosyltransferase YjiC (YdhE family)